MSADALSAFEARTIIESLRKGVVPVEHVRRFTVGRERWLDYVRSDLVEYVAQGGSKVRFINGDYGDGKTHFMAVIQHLARQEGFAVSSVVLTREVPLHRFEAVYREIVRRLQGQPEAEGIRALVEGWLAGLAEDTEPAALAETLRALPGMDLSFAGALGALAGLHLTPAGEGEGAEARDSGRDVLLRWLEGNRISKRELKPFQVFESLDRTNSKRMLASLIAFLRYLGYTGLVLLLDEVETVMARSSTIRDAAYENVRLLIDSAEQTQHIHVFLSIIPDVLAAEKGFRSYDALWSRVRTLGDSKRLNYRSVLIDLHRTPLGREEFLELGRRLRQIHGAAYSWDGAVVGDERLQDICEQQDRMGVTNEVRLFIRQLIQILDAAEQGEEAGVDLAGQAAAVEQERRDELGPRWDR